MEKIKVILHDSRVLEIDPKDPMGILVAIDEKFGRGDVECRNLLLKLYVASKAEGKADKVKS